jgi:hypothetical protein
VDSDLIIRKGKMFFGKAMSVATDKVLIKRVKQNQVNVEKKIK